MARVERLLLIVAVVSLGWYATGRASAMLYQAAQAREFEELRLVPRDIYLPSHAASASPAAPSSTAARSSTAADSSTAAPSSPAAPRPRAARSLVGRIEIPRLGVSAIVREGVDTRTLSRAVGHVPHTALPGDSGNIAFAAHRDTFFRPLKNIRAGDRIRVSTPDGDFTYIVRDTRIVAPTEVSVLDPTPEPTLTLITCHPFNYVGPAPNRFIVRADAVDAR